MNKNTVNILILLVALLGALPLIDMFFGVGSAADQSRDFFWGFGLECVAAGCCLLVNKAPNGDDRVY